MEMLSQVLGAGVMLLAVGASIVCFKRGRRKAGLAIIALFLALIVALTVVNRVYGVTSYSWDADYWGNKVEIWINYSQSLGGTAKVKATAYYLGGSAFGLDIGAPLFYGDCIYIYIYGYKGGSLAYYKSYASYTGWQYSKYWTFSLGAGFTDVKVKAKAYFDSIPFGKSSVTCTCVW